jgi:hypothetical protein
MIGDFGGGMPATEKRPSWSRMSVSATTADDQALRFRAATGDKSERRDVDGGAIEVNEFGLACRIEDGDVLDPDVR